jgi:hypothetical protein
MTLYERYIAGETKTVYDDIEEFGESAFLPNNYADIEKVLDETFERVAFNLSIIYRELLVINYVFKTEFECNSDKPLKKPLINSEKLLAKLDKSLKPFGFVPESLKIFYKVVGSCNFAWDYETAEDSLWKYADPIQIASLDDLVNEVTNEDFISESKEYYEGDGFVALELAADFYTKDNVSGGLPYSIKLTNKPSIDAPFLYEEHDTTFVNYLRICFDNCGFSRMNNPDNINDYQKFFDKVRPQLKKI